MHHQGRNAAGDVDHAGRRLPLHATTSSGPSRQQDLGCWWALDEQALFEWHVTEGLGRAQILCLVILMGPPLPVR